MKRLTERQRRIWRALTEHGDHQSLRELAKRAQLSGTSVVRYNLLILADREIVRLTGGPGCARRAVLLVPFGQDDTLSLHTHVEALAGRIDELLAGPAAHTPVALHLTAALRCVNEAARLLEWDETNQ